MSSLNVPANHVILFRKWGQSGDKTSASKEIGYD
jgi:hypothetical protein